MNLGRLLLITLLATIVVTAGYGLSTAASDDDDKDKHGSISLKDIPDCVKATMLAEILREVREIELEEIEREKEGGRVVYEAELEYGETEIELEIAADGKLLSKEVRLEDDDDDDDHQ